MTLFSGHQALQCFKEAATEVEKEEFLMRLTGMDDDEVAPTPRLQYYNKVRESKLNDTEQKTGLRQRKGRK